MTTNTIEASVIIPTCNRKRVLLNTLKSIAKQDVQPTEIIIIDASSYFEKLNYLNIDGLRSNIIHQKAKELGAAKQRNQGISLANTNVIGFFDDDIFLEEHCIRNLWKGLQQNPSCGGINAIITNQSYHPPGKISKIFYKLMGADVTKSLGGKCVGPAINFLPEVNSDKNFNEVEWLNTTCTLYRKDVLPSPVFDEHFTGYSLMEDLALSLRVGKNWLLLNSPQAKIYHNSQPGEQKNNIKINAEMDLVNRFYIMKYILNKNSPRDHFHLLLQQLFGAIASKKLYSGQYIQGKLDGLKKIIKL